jgi:DNA-binding Lrp family transcriptional regulator
MGQKTKKSQSFSHKLDLISENIIFLLSLNSKETISNLAKKLNINRKIVETRYNHLFDNNLIKYITVSNEKSKLRYTIYIKLNKIHPALIERVRKIGSLIKLKETLGAYDLSLMIEADSQKEADQTIAKISNIFHNCIIKFDAIRHILEDTAGGFRSFCHDAKFLAEYEHLDINSNSLTKDQHIILKLIKKDPNFTYASLREKSGFSYKKIKRIIDHFVSINLVRLSVDPDYNQLDLEFHNVLLKIVISRQKEFEAYMVRHPRVHWMKRSLGRWDYVLSVTAQDINEFVDVMRDIRSDNNDIILEETTLISKVSKRRRQ